MTRLRWLLGAMIAGVSLLAAGLALRTYLVHKLWLGGLAVMVLAVIAAVGFTSLARARLRLWRELNALSAEPAGGELLTERRQQLEKIRQTAARPDLDALAAATAAAELGRAYLGKYLVAVTVLVGLVGTFAGLMETLRGVAPLLADEQMTTLRALAGPLAGLDVTFGASLVGILVTLSLALVQGDLALAEEATLARLEERTRHVLLPALWPTAEAADERTLAEMSALRAELGEFLIRTSAAAAEKVAAVAKVEVDRMVVSVRDAVADSVQGTAGRVESGLLSLAQQVEARLAPIFAAQEHQLTSLRESAERAHKEAVAAGAQAATTIATATEKTLTGLDAALGDLRQTQEALLRDTGAVVLDLATATEQATFKLGAALQDLGAAQAASATQILAAHASECQKLDRSLHELADSHAASSTQLLAAHAAQVAKIDATLVALGEKHAAVATQLLDGQAAQVQKVDAALLAVAQTQADAATKLLDGQAAQVQKVDAALLAVAKTQAEATTKILDGQAAQVQKVDAALLAVAQTQAEATTKILDGQVTQAQVFERSIHDIVASQAQGAAELLAAQATQTQELATTLRGLGQEQARVAQQLLASQVAAEEQRAQSREALSQQMAETLTELSERHLAHSQTLQSEAGAASERREGALQALYEQHAAQLSQTATALCKQIETTVGGQGLQLAGAAEALQRTATELCTATASLQAPLSALTPELSALSREVALLAAEHSGDEPSATLNEILRLGDGIERLEALLRLGGGVAEHSEPALRPGDPGAADKKSGQAA
jgi:hypothetical protein